MLKSSKSYKFYRMALSACFFALIVVLFGAYVRYADARLGCPDWPGCYGKTVVPMTAKEHNRLRQLEEQHASAGAAVAPAKKVHAWRDVVSRYLSGALGLILIRLAWLGWQLKKRKRNQQWIIPTTTLIAVFGMVVLSVATIDLQYKPLVMLINFIGALTILALLWWIVMREQRFFRSIARLPGAFALRLRALLGILIVSVTTVFGVWSMVNYAGLACPDFPTCQGSYWPAMDFFEGLVMWRETGLEFESASLDLPGATAIHMAHRLTALAALLYVGWLALRVARVGAEGQLCRYGVLVLIVLLSGVVLGVMQVLMRMPLSVSIAHSAAAALLLMSLVTLYHVAKAPRTGN